AERAFEQLEKNADRLTALKLLKVNEKHLASLDPLVAQLAGKNGEQDEAEHEKYAAVVERLAGLQQRVAAFCETDMPQGMGLAPEPARAETKLTPTKSTPAKPTPTKPTPA